MSWLGRPGLVPDLLASSGLVSRQSSGHLRIKVGKLRPEFGQPEKKAVSLLGPCRFGRVHRARHPADQCLRSEIIDGLADLGDTPAICRTHNRNPTQCGGLAQAIWVHQDRRLRRRCNRTPDVGRHIPNVDNLTTAVVLAGLGNFFGTQPVDTIFAASGGREEANSTRCPQPRPQVAHRTRGVSAQAIHSPVHSAIGRQAVLAEHCRSRRRTRSMSYPFDRTVLTPAYMADIGGRGMPAGRG